MKKSNGITLIALVITIIVLIILAGISIRALTVDNGTIGEAKEAKKGVEQKGVEEQVDIAILQVKQENKNPVLQDIIDKLIKHDIIDEDSQVNKETGDITTNLGYVVKDRLNEYLMISKYQSYVGYYADFEGDGIIDGIIYADLAVGGSGTWNGKSWSSCCILRKQD